MMTMKFEGWMGMVIGPAIAYGVFLKLTKGSIQPIQQDMLPMFLVMGLAGGLLVWFFDAMAKKTTSADDQAKAEDQKKRRAA